MLFRLFTVLTVFVLSVYGSDGILNKSLIEIDGKAITLMFVVKFFAILLVGLIIAWIYKNKVAKSKIFKSKLSQSTQTLLGNIGYYFIIFIAIVTSLNSIGLNLSSLAVVAGALSVGIGFGLQNIVSNFISGIILMFEKSVNVGDYVELENGVRGNVTEIRLRATIVTTNEHIDVIVPNSNFIQNSVTNLTLNDEILRLRIPFGVAYGTSVQTVQDTVLKGVVEDPNLPHKKDDPLKSPRIWMTAMNASSVDFELVIWVEGENTRKRRSMTSLYLIKIYEILNQHHITIPFPQMDLYVKELPKQ
ncbi:MAG: mechanosensitive ion channel [Campylobacterales bacterium]|nr:mechanosensitive ion channel [Campylobacterales bacterium]